MVTSSSSLTPSEAESRPVSVRHRPRFTVLPSPAEISEYERLVPGMASQFVELLSLELENRRRRHQAMLEMEAVRRRSEDRLGFISAMVSVVAAATGAAAALVYILHGGKPVPVVAVLASLPAVVGTVCTAILFTRRAGRTARRATGASDDRAAARA